MFSSPLSTEQEIEPFEGPAGWISLASPDGAGAGTMLRCAAPQSGAHRARRSDDVPPWVIVRLVPASAGMTGEGRNDEGV